MAAGGRDAAWYLGRWGTLGRTPGRGGPDHFHYNPHDPTPAVGARPERAQAGRKDQRRREHRHDVVTYTSPVLTRT